MNKKVAIRNRALVRGVCMFFVLGNIYFLDRSDKSVSVTGKGFDENRLSDDHLVLRGAS